MKIALQACTKEQRNIKAYLSPHTFCVLYSEELKSRPPVADQIEVLFHPSGPRARSLDAYVQREVLVVGGRRYCERVPLDRRHRGTLDEDILRKRHDQYWNLSLMPNLFTKAFGFGGFLPHFASMLWVEGLMQKSNYIAGREGARCSKFSPSESIRYTSVLK